MFAASQQPLPQSSLNVLIYPEKFFKDLLIFVTRVKQLQFDCFLRKCLTKLDLKALVNYPLHISIKVFIDKSRGGVSLVEQDTIEIICWPI